jgi:hypothetical protein
MEWIGDVGDNGLALSTMYVAGRKAYGHTELSTPDWMTSSAREVFARVVAGATTCVRENPRHILWLLGIIDLPSYAN